jgi:hypothetical protein
MPVVTSADLFIKITLLDCSSTMHRESYLEISLGIVPMTILTRVIPTAKNVNKIHVRSENFRKFACAYVAHDKEGK